jgi:hypothetical protein
MIAKAAGKTLGIARNAHIHITVVPRPQYLQENFLDGLLRIYDDIAGTTGRAEVSIVNFSVNWPSDQISENFATAFGMSMSVFYDGKN